jgi:hypothetical protein
VSAVAWLVGVTLFGGLPSSHTTVDTGCTLRARVVIVNLPNREDGPVLRHAWDAIRAGQPEILHIDREDAQAHRRASLRGIPKVPGKDLDEYPPAIRRSDMSASPARNPGDPEGSGRLPIVPARGS